MLRIALSSLATVLTLAGCSSLAKPSVESALIGARARPPVAACMAQRMTDRLSLAELQKLERVQARPGEKTTGLSAAEVIERVGRVDDPHVVAVTASAGAACLVSS